MPSISVVIPVHNGAAHLRSCLSGLAESTTPYLECIVVDDGSTDDSSVVATELGARVLSTGGRAGPARARNIGAGAAAGEIVLFLDADVRPYSDTLARIAAAFQADPELDALIGSYDDSPECPDFLSQYRNLMHCFVHQTSRRRACTFWSGCGAIRRSVFFEHAGFDESYRRPAIEDIELGYRLFMSGRKLILDKDVRVKHLKRWTFWGLLKTDILDRGIPWTELILRDRYMPNDLNLELSQRVSVALVFILMMVTTAAAVYWGWYFLVPVMAVVLLLLSRYWLEPAPQPHPRPATIVMGALIALIAWRAWLAGMLVILPLLLLAYLLLLVRHRYAHTSERMRNLSGVILGVYVAGALAFLVTFLPAHVLILAFFLVSALVVIVNNQFYLFLAAKQGRLFALAAVPFHLLYHFYNGISFIAGLAHYTWRSIFGRHSRRAPARPGKE